MFTHPSPADSLFIDFSRLQKFIGKRLISIPGFDAKNFVKNFDLASFLKSLDVWITFNISQPHSSNLCNYSHSLEFNPDFSGFLDLAKSKQLIKDFIGIGKKIKNKIVFTTLVGEQPKPYLLMYLLFAKRVKKNFPALEFVIHLEDWFPGKYLSEKAKRRATLNYERFIHQFNIVDRIIFTSSLFPRKLVSSSFIKKTLSNVTLEDFLSVLPFQKRSLEFILFDDLFHFVWNIFTIFSIPGIYLTSMNSKREFLIFRKSLLGDPPVIFFPSAPEDISSEVSFKFYSRYFSFAEEKTKRIWLNNLFSGFPKKLS